MLSKASGSAFRGGVAGFVAGVVQVGSFMWMRTAMNFQYANGGTMLGAIATLYKARQISGWRRATKMCRLLLPRAVWAVLGSPGTRK